MLYLTLNCIYNNKANLRKVIANMDFWGATTSVLCAIHCALLPVFLSLGLIGAHSFWSHPVFEYSMIAIAVIFVYNSIIKGYFKKEVHFMPFLMAISGLSLVVTHHFFHANAVFIVVLGGILVALAHFINLLFGKEPHI